MIRHIENELNQTTTDNGDVAYKSTLDTHLDIFGQISSYRNSTEKDILAVFSKAYSENDLIARKLIFWARDVRGGAGERRFFRICLKWIAENNPEDLTPILDLVPEYGRWDDLFVLFDTPLEEDMLELVSMQLAEDYLSETPSLLAKHMPSINTSSEKTNALGRRFVRAIGTTQKKYRKFLSAIRSKLSIVEKAMSEKRWTDINYDKIPSKAGLKYRAAFYRNDEDRYTRFLSDLSDGVKKVNSSALYPYEVISPILDGNDSNDILLQGMWENLPDYISGSSERILPLIDVSGSMNVGSGNTTPIKIAISLGMYLSERLTGEYKNHFMTFSEQPQLVKITGKTVLEKVRNINRADWDMSTDLDSVFELLLKTAIKNKISTESLPTKIMIFSDMQFNSCTKDTKLSLFRRWKMRFKECGYTLPDLVFWNLDASTGQLPVTKHDSGTLLVSGFSPSLMKGILSNKTVDPVSMMLEVISSERYEPVV